MAAEPFLVIRDLNVFRGQSHILQDVSLTLGHEPLAIVGRNGMGKTTLCQPLMGLLPIRSGTITLGGATLAGRRPFRIARAGIGYVPQGRRIFPSLSVQEHLRLVAGRQSSGWTVERIYNTFPRLAERRRNGGGELSGGEQQMLAIARALLLNPKILVMVNGRIALETSTAQLAANEELQHRTLGVGPAIRPPERLAGKGQALSKTYAGSNSPWLELIPNLSDRDLCARLRSPMDMIVQGWSTSLFQAAQQWSTRLP